MSISKYKNKLRCQRKRKFENFHFYFYFSDRGRGRGTNSRSYSHSSMELLTGRNYFSGSDGEIEVTGDELIYPPGPQTTISNQAVLQNQGIASLYCFAYLMLYFTNTTTERIIFI